MAKPIRQPRRITAPEMLDALARSGYLLESRIERVLRSIGYDVTPNWTYPDPDTGKSRELDAVGHTDRWMDRGGDPSNHVFHWLQYELFIECVNNPQPVVFFTRDEPDPHLNAWSIRYTGQPLEITTKPGESQRVPNLLKLEEFHHYCGRKYATQYCSFVQKKNSSDWMAFHEDDHHLTFKKLIDAIFYRYDQEDDDDEDEPTRDAVDLTFLYPIVVLEGDLLQVNPWARKLSPRKADHVRFSQSAIYDGQQYPFSIDIVTERSFRRFMRLLEREFEEIYRRMFDSFDILLAAVKADNRAINTPPQNNGQ